MRDNPAMRDHFSSNITQHLYLWWKAICHTRPLSVVLWGGLSLQVSFYYVAKNQVLYVQWVRYDNVMIKPRPPCGLQCWLFQHHIINWNLSIIETIDFRYSCFSYTIKQLEGKQLYIPRHSYSSLATPTHPSHLSLLLLTPPYSYSPLLTPTYPSLLIFTPSYSYSSLPPLPTPAHPSLLLLTPPYSYSPLPTHIYPFLLLLTPPSSYLPLPPLYSYSPLPTPAHPSLHLYTPPIPSYSYSPLPIPTHPSLLLLPFQLTLRSTPYSYSSLPTLTYPCSPLLMSCPLLTPPHPTHLYLPQYFIHQSYTIKLSDKVHNIGINKYWQKRKESHYTCVWNIKNTLICLVAIFRLTVAPFWMACHRSFPQTLCISTH